MIIEEAFSALSVLPLRLKITPRQVLKLPAENQGNTLRGAFGGAFRRLVCIPQCREARRCPLDGIGVAPVPPFAGPAHAALKGGATAVCPYRAIFEPSPPPGINRLSKNQDAPRPFIFRPPLDFGSADQGPGARVRVKKAAISCQWSVLNRHGPQTPECRPTRRRQGTTGRVEFQPRRSAPGKRCGLQPLRRGRMRAE